MHYPLSRDEHAAVVRYLADIRKQLQVVSNLFVSRYGDRSRIADLAGQTLLSSTLLEQEILLLAESAESIEMQVKSAARTI